MGGDGNDSYQFNLDDTNTQVLSAGITLANVRLSFGKQGYRLGFANGQSITFNGNHNYSLLPGGGSLLPLFGRTS